MTPNPHIARTTLGIGERGEVAGADPAFVGCADRAPSGLAASRINPGERAEAAAEIGRLVNHIVALAPVAGLYIGIKIEPAKGD